MSKNPTCSFFLSAKGCKMGNRCNRSHELSSAFSSNTKESSSSDITKKSGEKNAKKAELETKILKESNVTQNSKRDHNKREVIRKRSENSNSKGDPNVATRSSAICKTFAKTSNCGYGDSCKYSHVRSIAEKATDETRLPTFEDHKSENSGLLASSAFSDHGGDIFFIPKVESNYWKILLHSKNNTITMGESQASLFLSSCLSNLGQSGDEILLALGSTNDAHASRVIITQLASQGYSVENNSSCLNFYTCALPFCVLLANRKIGNSILSENTSIVYHYVKNGFSNFLSQYIECLKKVSCSKHISHLDVQYKLTHKQMSLVPFAFAQLLIPIIRVLFFMMTLHKTISFEIYILDAIKTLNEITDNLMSQADSLSTMDTKFTFKIVRNELARITSIGNESRKKLDLADVFSKYELQLKTTNKLLNSVKNPWKHSDVLIVPGNENNRCHDNDFEHIGAISILPTMGELLSELQPNLPGNHMDVEKAHWLPEGPERLLDTHFRLLREDLVGPIRDNITSYFKFLANPSQFTKKYYNGRLQATPTGKLSAQKVGSVDICVHEGVIFESLQISRHNGISIVLKFDHPPNLPTKPKIKQYWESGGNLANGAMVGLVIKHPDMGNTPLKVIFGCVTDRDEKKLVRDRPEISVVFPVKYLDGEVFKCLLNCKGHVLIENNNIMFESYRPILATLQNMNPATLPFAKYLCYPSRRQNEQSDKVTDPPLYAMVPNYMINLNNLWPGIPNYAFDPNNATERKSCLEFLSKHNAFDKSQAAAFINALISDISCIQGPPGTGKSFIGVQLVRTILQNRSFITPNAPILLICFTNHALDQFLLHLLKLGIDSIARLGGNSKVEELQELSAFNLERFEKSRGQKRGEWECFREMDELRDKLHKLNNNIFKWEPNWKDISEHLTIFQPDQYMSFLVMLEYIEEEQRTWTKKGKKDFDIIDYWKNGEDLALTQHEELEDQPDSDKITRKGINRFSLLSVDGNLSKGSSSAKPPTVNKPKPKKIVVKDIEELMELPDVWLMIIPERQRLLAYWKETIFDSRLQQINYLSTKIDKCQKKLQTLRDSGLADILRNKEIIGVTTTGAAKYSNLIKSLNYRIVICEEAGEVLESHILASLQPTVQQLIMIGDHFQLRPHLALHSLSAESNTGKKYQLDLSLFERLQNPNYKFPLQTLEVQRRMRPEISELIRKTLYPSLSDSIMVEDRENVPGVKDNVFFMDHTAPEDDKGQGIQGNSHSNEFEADYVIGLLQFLLRKGYKPDDIVILTPYVGQLLKIRKKLQSLYTVFISDRDTSQLKVEFQEEELNDEVNYEVIAEKKKLGQCIRVSTIDNYQGEESKIVIISLVRNKKGKKGSIGINVLLSRAQFGMYILGNRSILESQSEMWTQVLNILDARKQIGPGIPAFCVNHPNTEKIIVKSEEFAMYFPDGGCTLPCKTKLADCGHVCPWKCHSDYPDHKGLTSFCHEKCARLHEECNHPCKKRCSEACGRCETNVGIVTLPCGHEHQDAKCYMTKDLSAIKCKVKVTKVLPNCNHPTVLSCHQSADDYNCPIPCGGINTNCHHKCLQKCSSCYAHQLKQGNNQLESSHLPCIKICEKILPCGHYCSELCHAGEDCPPCTKICTVWKCSHSSCNHRCSDPCYPCQERCDWKCEHEDQCPLICGAPCTRLPCDKRCSKVLSCGHKCPSVCGEICPSSFFCQTCASDSIKSQIVDKIMFSEYQDIDLEEDPIFVLPCNHIFTMSTMDGWLDINQGYRQDQNGKWSIVSLPMQFSKLPVCPDCRFLIRGLRRYGRICNQASLNLSEKCFITSIMKGIESLRIRKTEEMNSFTSRIDSLEAKLLQKSQKLTLSKHLTVYKSPFEKFIKEVFKCFQKATKSPQKKVYESCVSHLDETESNSFLAVPKPHLFLERSLFSMLIDCKVFITKFNLILYNRMKSNSLDNFQRLKSDYDKDMEKIMTDFDNYLGKTQETGAMLSTSGAEIEFHRLDIEGEYLESIQENHLRIPLAKDLESRFDHFLGRSPSSFLTKCVTKLDTFKTQLLKLNDSIRTPLTLEEKQSIATAINFQGTWYNCPNGHPYAIGECGGAMEVGTCYECGVRIGGSHHTSLPGNVRASFG